MEKISVVIATYNGSRFLKELLDSLYSQTRVPDEVIVVDDCSKDATVDILEQYHSQYGLKYYVNKRNMGVNANFYKAISLCSGDYVCICDQDDVWLPYKIEKTLEKMKEIENGKMTVVSTRVDHIDAQGNAIAIKSSGHHDISSLAANILYRNITQGCTMMLNRKLIDYAMQRIKTFGINQDIMYDAYLGYIAAFTGNKYYLGLVTMHYRHHDGNVCGKIKTEKKKRSLSEYFGRNWIYDRFIPESRISRLSYIYNVCKDDITDNRVKQLVFSLQSLQQDKSLCNGFSVIWSIKEYSRTKRLFYFFNACLIKAGKILFT